MENFFNKNQIEKITNLALEAGEIAAKSFRSRDFAVQRKTDNSKVTSADITVSEFLREKLNAEFPQIPIICEEGNLREINEEVFWLIDPIDGTSSFINNNVEFSVNIALIKNKKAVFGLIYAPLFEDGKMIFSNEKNQVICKVLSKKEKILSPQNSAIEKLRIITSSRSKDIDVENYVAQIYPQFSKNFVTEKLASSIKFFRILESDADLYLHLRESMEWDTAAGQALIELMGGKVKNLFFNQNKTEIGENLIYKKLNFLNQPFISFIKNF